MQEQYMQQAVNANKNSNAQVNGTQREHSLNNNTRRWKHSDQTNTEGTWVASEFEVKTNNYSVAMQIPSACYPYDKCMQTWLEH